LPSPSFPTRRSSELLLRGPQLRHGPWTILNDRTIRAQHRRQQVKLVSQPPTLSIRNRPYSTQSHARVFLEVNIVRVRHYRLGALDRKSTRLNSSHVS